MSDMDDLIRGARAPEPDVRPTDLDERLRVLTEHGFSDRARDLLRRYGQDVPEPSGFDGGARRPVAAAPRAEHG